MPMIDTVLVPQGAEYQAVYQGCVQSLGSQQTMVRLLPIPVGPFALRRYLTDRLETKAFQPGSKVLVLGLCGSLSAKYSVGNTVIYQGCVDGTSDVSASSIPLCCDSPFNQALIQRFPAPIQPVTALTSDRLIQTAAEKQALATATQAEVVDMEGYTVLEVLRALDVAVAMIRVVSDGVTQTLPNLSAAFGENGSLKPLPLAWGMIRQPIAAAHLIGGSLKGLSRLKTVAAIVTKAV